MKYRVLIVEDDALVNELLTETCQRAGYEVTTTMSGEDGVARFQDNPADIVLTDLKMGEMDGITVLEQVRKTAPETIVVMMTAYGTVETAVKAIKKGAYDFLLKPVLPETVEHILGRIAEILDLRHENEQLKRDLSARFQNMIGKSHIMREVFDLISSIADARSTIMLTGPSGTGKEMVARAIHMTSARRNGPFVKLNCAAIPETLVEAELFGYEKGAFTDAKKTNHGRFELADNGTLLLDEISEMPLNLQSKLLRVIQEREFERVGSSQTIKVDVRIIATSNRNLKEYISAGRFREDLFYRLNVIPIHLPSLAERSEDIPLLVDHFIEKYNRENHKQVKGVTPGTLRLFLKYPWPGNVRELENLIERAVVTSRADYLTEDDFPVELALGDIPGDGSLFKEPMTMAEAGRVLILKALERAGGNKTRAAKELDITARTIRNKLAEYGIQD